MRWMGFRVAALVGVVVLAILYAQLIALPAIRQDSHSAGQRSRVVVVEQAPARKETVYRIEDGSCHIRWTVYNSELNEGIVRQQTDCKSPLAMQADLVVSLLDRMLSDQGASTTFHTLFLGDLGSFPEMSARLALAAKRSRDWDAVLGRPKSGTLNEFFLKTTNQSQIYDELTAAFHHFHLQILATSVENVVISRAAKLSFHTEIERQGVKAEDKIPSGGLVWFSVAPESMK
jgi:hypothetical protein